MSAAAGGGAAQVPPGAMGPSIDGSGGGPSSLQLHNELNMIQRRQAVDAVRNMMSYCHQDLSRHGIDVNALAVTAGTIEYYSEYLDGSLKVSDVVPSFDSQQLTEALGGNVAVTLENAYGQITNKVVLSKIYFTQVNLGSDLATSQNITLVHEALHVQTGYGDVSLAMQMGLGKFEPAEASRQISYYLAGCF